jgi:hypothetical protein
VHCTRHVLACHRLQNVHVGACDCAGLCPYLLLLWLNSCVVSPHPRPCCPSLHVHPPFPPPSMSPPSMFMPPTPLHLCPRDPLHLNVPPPRPP